MPSPQPSTKTTSHFQKCPYVLLCNCAGYVWKITWHEIYSLNVVESALYCIVNYSYPGLPHCRWIFYQLSHKGSPRILQWVAYPFSSGSSQPRNRTEVSWIAVGFFTNWAIREACNVNDNPCFKYEMGFPCGSTGKESACNVGDMGSIHVGKIPWRRERLPTHSRVLAWRIRWTVQSMGSQRDETPNNSWWNTCSGHSWGLRIDPKSTASHITECFLHCIRVATH